MALCTDKTRSKVEKLINQRWGNPGGNVLQELQNELFDLGIVGQRIPKKVRGIVNSITFAQESIELDSQSYTNSFDLSYDAKDSLTTPAIESREKPFALYELFNNPNIIGAINAGFFCLVDESCQYPLEASYDLCIRDNHIYGLPFADRPALLKKDNKLSVKEILSKGIISIDNKDFTWKGMESYYKEETDFILYNSSCCTVKHKVSPNTGTIRVLEEYSIYTSYNPNIIDVLVCNDGNNILRIKSIHKGGSSNLFDGNFVLRFFEDKKFNFKPGMIVMPKTVDGLGLSSIQSGITIGPNVYHFLDHDDHDINHDTCHGSKKPTYSDRRSAVSVIYEDLNGRVHLQIFDGVPSIKQFSGITAREVTQILPRNKTKWAYLLDPGQSSKILIKEKTRDLIAFGNTHYVSLARNKKGHNKWAPLEGRAIGSAITLTCK